VTASQKRTAEIIHLSCSPPAHTLGDINATLLFGQHYSITAYVRNITDNRFIPDTWGLITTAGPAPGGIVEGNSTLSDPRTFGVIVSYKY